MKIFNKDEKFAYLGKPGLVFSKGFRRRLDLVSGEIDLRNKIILDHGCGEGVWIEQFKKFTKPSNVYGFDIENDSIKKIQKSSLLPKLNLKVCKAEELKFKNDFFNIVFSNEVLEHVEDDKKSIEEVFRVLKKGGIFVAFTPNKGWPFETHGIVFKNKYYWGNIPFVPWLPKKINKILTPHVRNYSNKDIKKLFPKEKWEFVLHRHVFPGFDGAVRRFGVFWQTA